MTQVYTPPPRATLRLQFHCGFTLDDAVPLVPYFSDLGISHLYASPLLCARSGSPHGYDVVDPGRVNPELGGEAALRRLVRAVARPTPHRVHLVAGPAASVWLNQLKGTSA